jgi:catechol 2,3-dioxygenase-like lactoylglutathione lyase family enzyme
VTEFNAILPVLKVADLQRAVEFYTQVLGFRVSWRAANDDGGENCMLAAGATNLLLSTGSHLGDKTQFTGTLYFSMIGVRQFFAQIKNQVQIVWPLEAMEYGQTEFGIKDCDGYILAFAEACEGDSGDRSPPFLSANETVSD